MKFDVAIIGGGPAGMASALSASQKGLTVCLIEREYRLGGILNQCIHNGFGLHRFGVEFTGPEYAKQFSDKVQADKNITVKYKSSVIALNKKDGDFIVKTTSPDGLNLITAKSVILAMGCRERPAGAINLCGNRVAGIYSAGTAQAIVNLQGKMIGKNIVILGSGDIGLIMARRLTFEGANVVGVYEMAPTCGGLARNVTQCLKDFNIPLHLSTTVTRVLGNKRVEGVMVAPVVNGKPDLTKETLVPCDTLLLSVGLVPEIELVSNFNLELSNVTKSFAVDEYLQTSEPGLFIAGNVLQVNDLVDNVSSEGDRAGENVALYVKSQLPIGKKIEIMHDEHIRYTVPKYFYKTKNGNLVISFRTDKQYEKVKIQAISNGEVIFNKPVMAVAGNIMETITIDKSKIKKDLSIVITSM